MTTALPLTSEEQETVRKDVLARLGGGATTTFRVDPRILGDGDHDTRVRSVPREAFFAFCDRVAPSDVDELVDDILARSEASMRRAIAAVPDGTWARTSPPWRCRWFGKSGWWAHSA